MRIVLSAIVTAIVALSYSAVVFAADTTITYTPPAGVTQKADEVQKNTDATIAAKEKAKADAAAKANEAKEAKAKAKADAAAKANEAKEAKAKAKAEAAAKAKDAKDAKAKAKADAAAKAKAEKEKAKADANALKDITAPVVK